MNKFCHDFFYRNIVSDNKRHRLLKLCLLFISFLVTVGQNILLFMYSKNFLKRAKLSSKVISIGGITLGGVGKTPVVELVANMLIKKGERVAVLSRGYGRGRESDIKLVSNGKEILCNVEEAGDEPYLLAKNLKSTVVFAGRNRYETGKIAEESFHIDTVVLDDGFQHWRLHRDINIVVINASSPFGNGYVFPRGNLREPLECLKRADCFVLTKIDMINGYNLENIKRKLLDINSLAQVITTIHKPVCLENIAGEEQLDIESIKGKKVIALSSLGDPVSFENTLEHAGAEIAGKIRYPDHHWYSEDDIDNVQARQKDVNAEFIITTQKDAVRLLRMVETQDFASLRVLRIEVEIISGSDRLEKLINAT